MIFEYFNASALASPSTSLHTVTNIMHNYCFYSLAKNEICICHSHGPVYGAALHVSEILR